jgi:protein subunit release factor B
MPVAGPVLPVHIPEDDDRLLAECEVETFRSSGKGGQNVNKVETAVRLRHLPTGITVTSRVDRSQYGNKLRCLAKLRRRLEQLNYRPPERVATRTPVRVKLNNREAKIRQSAKKRLRRAGRRPEME